MQNLYLEYFFTYETTLPGGIGFGMFGIGHLVWLAMIVIETVGYMKWYQKASAKGRRNLEILAAGSLIMWIVLRAVYIAVLHENFLYELPLHLCSMAGILCGVHCMTRWDWLGQVLYSLCLPGAILALIFPNWCFYPAIHFLSIEAFLFHMGIVNYVLILLYSHKIVPDIRKIWQVFLFMVGVVIPIYFFDKRYDVNYMFVNRPSAGSPLVWLADWMGDPGYLIGYAGLMVLCVALMDLGYIGYVRRRKNHFLST